MSHNVYHAIRQRCWPIMRLVAWIITASLVLSSTPLLLAQSTGENATSNIFLPVVSQSTASTDAQASVISPGCGGTSVSSNFNGTAIAGGRWIWFNSVFKISGVGSAPTTLTFTNQTIQFSANGTAYNLPVPNAQITFNDTSVTNPRTNFNSATNTWETRLSGGPLSGNTFLSGLAFQVPGGFSGGINPVTWTGTLATDNASVTKVEWKWAAAVYTSFSADYNALSVKPVDEKTDQYANSDHAGTPENFKNFVIGGARGGGGSNFTGSYSGTASVTCFSPIGPTPTPTPTPGGPTPTPTPQPPVTTAQKCYIGTNNPAQVSAQQSWTVNPSARTVTIRTTLAKTFVDNTYGANAIGWGSKGHTFGNLTGSDQLQLALSDASGVKRLEFKIDYLTSSSGAPSGYDTLGVNGGDGQMIVGNAAQVLNAVTSLDVNFNQFGYVLTTDSPATNASYAPNPQYPNWIFDVWYEVTVSLDAFGAAGFGTADITGVHASPSKTGNNTEPVSPTPCPTPPTPTPTPTNTPAPLGSLGDRVWNDFNRNGIQEGGEPGVPNVTVQLKDCSGNILQSIATDANGIYRFSNLPAACYSVGVVLPGGFQFSPQDQGGNDNTDSDINPGTAMTGPVNLGPGQNIDTVDAGINQPTPLLGSLGDRVWRDDNVDGIQNAGEPGVPGVIVQLKDCSNNILRTITTDNNGLYGFADLAAGCYRVGILRNGYTISPANQGSDDTRDSDVDPTTAMTGDINLAAGQNDPTIDVGVYPSASLGDRVWNDTNRNGVQDGGEAGVPNVTVTLLSGCSGNTVINTTVTNAGGNYNFSGLAAGQYRVQMSLPAGFQFSPQNQGGNDTLDSDVNVANGISDCITLTPGQNDPTWDAGINQPAPALGSLGDFVWNDGNANGVQEVNEPGIDGIQVELYNCTGSRLAQTVTSGGGRYQFNNLPAACYRVRFVDIPATFAPSPANQGGDDARDSDATNFFSVTPGIFTGETDNINLGVGENNPTVDQGLYRPATLGDTVFNDTNRNGVQDSGEPGVPNVTITLLRDCSGNTVVNTTTTNASGNYSFSGLVAGQYRIQVTLPDGFQFSPQNQGGNDTLDSDINVVTGISDCITLTPGQNDPTWDAGINQPQPGLGAIGDFVWKDLNENGQQDGGEPGVPDVTVKLLDGSGNVLQTTTTNSSGFYQFTNLPAGTYAVMFVAPANHSFTWGNAGPDASDSDANATTGMTVPIVLGAGETNNTIDAGLINGVFAKDHGFGDVVFLDDNGDGVQNVNEPGLQGVTVELISTQGNVLNTQTTGPGGYYAFLDLVVGASYSVRVTLPAGYSFTTPNVGSDDTIDSDFDPNTGQSPPAVVVVGPINSTVDAGLRRQ